MCYIQETPKPNDSDRIKMKMQTRYKGNCKPKKKAGGMTLILNKVNLGQRHIKFIKERDYIATR